MAERLRIWLIINPISGTRHGEDIGLLARNTLDNSRFDLTLRYTERKGHGAEIAREAVAAGVDIVAFGAPNCWGEPEKPQDWTVLDAVCRRVRLDHVATPAGELSGFDMRPFESGWVAIGRDMGKGTPYESTVAQAQQLVQSKLPIAIRDDAGKEHALDGDRVDVQMIASDMKMAYAKVVRLSRKHHMFTVTVGSETVVVHAQGAVSVIADLVTKSVRLVHLKGPAPMPSPDGSIFVSGLDRQSIQVYGSSLAGVRLRVDADFPYAFYDKLLWFPDARFVLYTLGSGINREYGVVSLQARRQQDGRDCAQHVPLPPLPELSSGTTLKRAVVTADGFHVVLQCTQDLYEDRDGSHVFKGREDRDIPWLRLSWSYEPPEIQAPRQAEASRPRKGFFARLFGKK